MDFRTFTVGHILNNFVINKQKPLYIVGNTLNKTKYVNI